MPFFYNQKSKYRRKPGLSWKSLLWGWVLYLPALLSAQSTPQVRTLLLICQVKLPGNIQVDSLGNEIATRDTVFTAYAVTRPVSIKWLDAWRGQVHYVLQARSIDTSYLALGVREREGTDLILRAPRHCGIWEIRLLPAGGGYSPPLGQDPKGTLLKYQIHGKVYYQKIRDLIQLQSIPSP